MYSNDYKKNSELCKKLIKMCGSRDQNLYSSIREVYDLFLKWVAIKMYAGNPLTYKLLELIPAILSVLEKKRVALTDTDIDLIFQPRRGDPLAGQLELFF